MGCHLQLAGAQRFLHIDACVGEPPEMFLL